MWWVSVGGWAKEAIQAYLVMQTLCQSARRWRAAGGATQRPAALLDDDRARECRNAPSRDTSLDADEESNNATNESITLVRCLPY